MITAAEQARRMAIYNEGGTVAEQAERCGMTFYAYRNWAARSGLKMKRQKPKPKMRVMDYDISKTPEHQRKHARQFLTFLHKADKHGPLNADQIGKIMIEWRRLNGAYHGNRKVASA